MVNSCKWKYTKYGKNANESEIKKYTYEDVKQHTAKLVYNEFDETI